MAKSLNELADSLKEFLINIQNDSHNKGAINSARYNNLKMEMKIAEDPTPHIIITLAMSEATFNIKTGEKMNGGLGPDERYVFRWFSKSSTMPELMEAWMAREKERGKAHSDLD